MEGAPRRQGGYPFKNGLKLSNFAVVYLGAHCAISASFFSSILFETTTALLRKATMTFLAQPLLDYFWGSNASHQLLLLAVPASLAFFTLLVLFHLDGRAVGASHAREDLEVVLGAWPLIGNLLTEVKMGDRGLEGACSGFRDSGRSC